MTTIQLPQILNQYPDLNGDMTDCLIGNLFRDFDPLFKAVAEFASVPEPLAHGKPLVASPVNRAYEFKLTRQVEFSDTDVAGIVHFSNFFRYMEAAEHAFFRSLGFSIHATGGDSRLAARVTPIVDFKHPLRFEDVVEISLLVREKRAKSIIYNFVFSQVE